MYYMLFRYKYTNNVFARLILRIIYSKTAVISQNTAWFQSLFLWASKAPYFFDNTSHGEVESWSASVYRFLRKALNERPPCH